MNVSKVYTMDYENISNWAKRTQFKSNSNPIYPVVASGEAGTNPISEFSETTLSYSYFR